MAVSRVLLMRTAVGLALCSLVACTSVLKAPEQADIKPWPEIRSDFRVETLRARLYEYSITFAAEVDLTASSIEQRTTDATVRRNALLWRIRAIPEMRKACFRMEPVSGLLDAWTLSRQMDQLFSDRRGGRRLRHIPARSRRGVAPPPRPAARDWRFDRDVSRSPSHVRAPRHRSVGRRTSAPRHHLRARIFGGPLLGTGEDAGRACPSPSAPWRSWRSAFPSRPASIWPTCRGSCGEKPT